MVLPVYNGAAFVERAIRSIRQQVFSDWELVVVDDGSTDASLDLCEALVTQDSRMRVFTNGTNQGLARTMNRLFSLARGAYVAVQEQDDVSEPCRLALEVEVLNSHPAVGLVSGVAAWIDDEGTVFSHFPGLLHRGEQYPQAGAAMVRFLYTEQCKVVNAACMFRRSAALEVPGPFDDRALMSIDWQFFLHLAHRHRFYGIPQVLVRMCRGRGHQSLSRKKDLQFREARRCIRLIYEQYSEDPSSPIDYWLYREAMATELVIEGRSYSRVKGLMRLLQAIFYEPAKARAWISLLELCGRASRRIFRRPGVELENR